MKVGAPLSFDCDYPRQFALPGEGGPETGVDIAGPYIWQGVDPE